MSRDANGRFIKGTSGNPTGVKGRKGIGLRTKKPDHDRAWSFVNWADLELIDVGRYACPSPTTKYTSPTVAARVKLRDAQGGCCPGCGVDFRLLRQRDIVVDHCHLTGKIRGILCQGCNKALGFIKDKPETARNLAAYLERNAQEVPPPDGAGKPDQGSGV